MLCGERERENWLCTVLVLKAIKIKFSNNNNNDNNNTRLITLSHY